MKKIWISLGVISVLILSACAGQSEKSSSTDHKQAISAKTKAIVANGLKIEVKKQEVNQKAEGKKQQQLYTFSIEAENVSAINKGIGAIDFVLKLKNGKEIKVDPSMAAFGDELKKGKSIKGTASFAVNSNETASKLVYKPVEKGLAEWDVNTK